MRFDFEKIKEITEGAAKVYKQDGRVLFDRFTEAENQPNQKIPAGIQLAFVTDAQEMKMKVYIPEGNPSPIFFAVDVLVGGKYVGGIQNFDEEDSKKNRLKGPYAFGEFEYKCELGEGEKEIKIFLPISSPIELCELSVEGESFVRARENKKIFLAYGDSITHGWTSRHPSNTMAVRLAEFLGAKLYNKGIGGALFCPELPENKVDFVPDFVTIAYGTNDWAYSKSLDISEENCRKFCKIISEYYPEAKKFIISPVWRADLNNDSPLGEFSNVEKMIKRVSDEFDSITFISGREMIPEDKELYSDLELHPNDRGFDFYYNNLSKEISKYL